MNIPKTSNPKVIPKFASIRPTSDHIVIIRSPDGDDIVGYQLRVDGGGAGNSLYFASGRYGSPQAALDAAQARRRLLDLPKAAPQSGGRHRHSSRINNTGWSGIRFVWTPGAGCEVLRVFASWIDRGGAPRTTSYSVERHGLSGALDLAIRARTSCGASAPDRLPLLLALEREYRRAGRRHLQPR